MAFAGITFEGLDVKQGEGDYTDSVIVKAGEEVLLVIQDVSDLQNCEYDYINNENICTSPQAPVLVEDITEADFTTGD